MTHDYKLKRTLCESSCANPALSAGSGSARSSAHRFLVCADTAAPTPSQWPASARQKQPLRSTLAKIALSIAAILAWSAWSSQARTPPATPGVAASTPEGYWTTVDEGTNTAKSVVFLWKEDGKMYGKVVKLFRQPNEDPDPLCDDCTGDLHKKPVLGMRILWDRSQDGSEWSCGRILDPDNGKTYKCVIEVIEGGRRLKVRGYIGFALIGRTQYWERVEKPL